MSTQTRDALEHSRPSALQSAVPSHTHSPAQEDDPFRLSAELEQLEYSDEEGDENVPPPGPSWQTYPFPGVNAHDIRDRLDNSSSAVFNRATRRAALALFEEESNVPWPSALLEGENAILVRAPSPVTPTLASPISDVSRPFGPYNRPLCDLPLHHFLSDAQSKNAERPDGDVAEIELPPLVVSPELRGLSDDDSSTL
ncbi:hypothetical protein BD413DRAFT_199934 [Trametes elegans]|nr:hypothetical protein BD413DRAFT_199934 [Trametes elegans]